MHIWVDGRLREPGEAVVSALDHGLTVGDGVFETVKVVDGVPFALSRHLDRLAVSARGLGLPEPGAVELRAAVRAVLAAERDDQQGDDGAPGALSRLRITWTGGVAPLSSERGDTAATLVVALVPMAPWPGNTAVAVVPWRRNERGATAGLKTTSYAENVVALAFARRHGASEAIFANTVGRLCEGTGSNVVLEADGVLVTPTLSSGCLAGVTRALALQWCGIEERDLPVEALRAAREVLLASTTRDLQIVHAVDGRPVGDGRAGPLGRAARAAFAAGMSAGPDP